MRQCSCCKKNKPDKDFYKGNPYHCKKCNISYVNRSRIKRDYGLSPTEYAALFVKGNNRCEICGDEFNNSAKHKLSIDHCHATGEIRGILCGNCNRAIGMVADNPTLLRRAAEYLTDAERIIKAKAFDEAWQELYG